MHEAMHKPQKSGHQTAVSNVQGNASHVHTHADKVAAVLCISEENKVDSCLGDDAKIQVCIERNVHARHDAIPVACSWGADTSSWHGHSHCTNIMQAVPIKIEQSNKERVTTVTLQDDAKQTTQPYTTRPATLDSILLVHHSREPDSTLYIRKVA